ncbi:MAG: DsrE/DsrF/DrsH-like family protein [Planctomycetota bacterium]|jgi:peroxiredoxin family protein
MAPEPNPSRRVALVCTNFTMQSAFGLLIIALNSARLGFSTMIYFTFEGLHMIRPGYLEKLKYFPTGVDPSEEEVERYTQELRERMDKKEIAYVEDMLEMAQLEGVKMLACKTSVDLFDLTQEDFIEGVEILLASDFMKQAIGSDLHLTF